MAVRVAINGFGRIGRNILRAIAESGRTDIEVVGINDLGPVETNAHLLRFDSVHGRFPGTVTVEGDSLSLGNGKIKVSAERGIAARVVSVPSLELLLEQPEARQKAVIGNAPVKVAIEAAVRWGWDAVIGHDGIFIGMHSFGESGPAKDLFKHFGITAEAAVNAVLKRLG